MKSMASELKGNTLKIYWYLLESSNKFVGPRQIQRDLGFSSPSLVTYHLDKLMDLGLVEKAAGEYHLTKIVDVGILKQFVKFKRFIVPRTILYATLFSTLLAFYLTQFKEVNFYSIFGLIFGLLGFSILWFETIKAWQNKP